MRKPTPAVVLSKKVGENIRMIRKKHGIPQNELVSRFDLIGVSMSRRVLGKIERGEKYVTIYDLFVISRALGVPADEILKGGDCNEGTAD